MLESHIYSKAMEWMFIELAACERQDTTLSALSTVELQGAGVILAIGILVSLAALFSELTANVRRTRQISCAVNDSGQRGKRKTSQ